MTAEQHKIVVGSEHLNTARFVMKRYLRDERPLTSVYLGMRRLNGLAETNPKIPMQPIPARYEPVRMVIDITERPDDPLELTVDEAALVSGIVKEQLARMREGRSAMAYQPLLSVAALKADRQPGDMTGYDAVIGNLEALDVLLAPPVPEQ